MLWQRGHRPGHESDGTEDSDPDYGEEKDDRASGPNWLVRGLFLSFSLLRA